MLGGNSRELGKTDPEGWRVSVVGSAVGVSVKAISLVGVPVLKIVVGTGEGSKLGNRFESENVGDTVSPGGLVDRDDDAVGAMELETGIKVSVGSNPVGHWVV